MKWEIAPGLNPYAWSAEANSILSLATNSCGRAMWSLIFGCGAFGLGTISPDNDLLRFVIVENGSLASVNFLPEANFFLVACWIDDWDHERTMITRQMAIIQRAMVI